MDIYGVIKQDHDTARAMLKALKATGDSAGARRNKLYPALKRELMMHQQVEDAVFYATLKAEKKTRPDALEAANEHHLVDVLLEELDIMPKDNDEWTAKFGVLSELVDHHMREEETEFFEHARKAIDADLAKRMGTEMTAKKAAGLMALEPLR
jgi:hypothetical protein